MLKNNNFKIGIENWENSLKNEYEADNLAREWGFDVDKFRKICGQPTIQS